MSTSLTEPQPALLEHRSFVAYWCARTATNGAYQMQAVAVGWQIYELTGSAFDLGLVGLVQFFPVVVLGVLIGHMADRYDRRIVVGTCQVVKALAAAVFAIGTIGDFLTRDAMLAILFVSGTARAFETPTMHTLVPGIVPPELLPRAIAASSTASQTATICGPAIGGLLYVFGAATVYLTCTAVFVLASVLVSLIVLQGPPPEKKPVTMETLFAGFSYIRHNKVVLGAISLDLFAMLLGGVTALLPVYARDVLATGPWGLGLLRSAPAIGALAVSAWLAHHQLERRIGHVLFAAVAVFGAATVAFAFSTSLLLSIAALAAYGAADAVSVVIRHSLVQTRTPNEMLGRVMAVNFMFTGTSGTLGEFRAGAVAALCGAFTSILVGGLGAIAVGLLWMRLFPEIARIDKIEAGHV
jgi:MFS family permease